MTGVEIDFVVKDSLKAIETYKQIFDVKVVEATSFNPGLNEVVFNLYDVRFHMLDENKEYMLMAPSENSDKSVWFNIMVPDINAVYKAAIAQGCTEIQPVTLMEEMGVSNAMFSDPFGYVWMLHEIRSVVPFEEREQLYKDL